MRRQHEPSRKRKETLSFRQRRATAENLEQRVLLASNLNLQAAQLAAYVPPSNLPDGRFAHTNYYIARQADKADIVARPRGTTAPVGLTPAQIRHAYGIDAITFLNGSLIGDGSGQTIAIVDAFDNPTFFGSSDVNYATSDLAMFNAAFGLPQFGAPGGPTFIKLDQTGGTSYPAPDTGWATEIALDVEWVHAIAPMANILLIEATDNLLSNLDAAVDFARNYPGVVAVSMSYGTSEFFDESSGDDVYTTPVGHVGVTFLAATGDSGSPGGYPAYSPNVVAVGGTRLNIDSSGNWISEAGWSGSGGGISSFEPLPDYQAAITNISNPTGGRMIPDVAFDADPSSGVAVYDSFSNGSAAPWIKVGGTSLSAPCWAGLVAIADQGLAAASLPVYSSQTLLPKLYQLAVGEYHDITGGSNGYPAGAAYDLVTGRGSPIALNLVPDLVDPGAPRILGTLLGPHYGLNPISTLAVGFNQAMDTTSFSILDDVVSFTGPGNIELKSTIANFAWLDAYTLNIGFAPTSVAGSYTMVVGPDILAADGVTPMDQDRDGTVGEGADDQFGGTFIYSPVLGPDDFGYRATRHPFESLDLIPDAPGVFTAVDGVDDSFDTIDLSSNTFNFYGTSYTGSSRLYVSANGLITFGSTNSPSDYFNGDLTTFPPQRTIAPLWDDWVTYVTSGGDGNDAVLYQFQDTTGDSVPDRLVIEWSNVYSIASDNSPVTFQAILQLNTGGTPGSIIFNYVDMNAATEGIDYGASATEGIKDQGSQGVNRLLIGFNDGTIPWLASGRAILIAPGMFPYVLASSVGQGATVSPVSSIEFKFTRSMDSTSFSIADDIASFTGPGGVDLKPTISGFSWVDDVTLKLDFALTIVQGAFTIVIGPDILSAVGGEPMDQDRDESPGEVPADRFTASFVYKTTLGPDGFGYVAAAYPFEGIDLIPGDPGVFSMLNGVDDDADAINLGGNTFNFYGVTYTGVGQLFVSSNGLITFETGNTNYLNEDLTAVPQQRSIAVLWDDFVTNTLTSGATDDVVLYQFQDTDGDSNPDRLVIEWSNVYPFDTGLSALTFQAILQLNTGATPGRIILNYVDLDAGILTINNGASATVGFKDAGAQGDNRLLISMDNGSFPWIAAGKAIIVSTDVIAPVVAGEQYQYQTGPALKLTFSENVGASLQPGDIELYNLTTPFTVPAANIATAYDAGTNTATVSFLNYPWGILPDGNYRLTIHSARLYDPSGNPLDGNADGIVGGDHVFEFFVLGGDANRDRRVDINDLFVLSTNWQGLSRTFAQGDFNYDGTVDSVDLGILASHWQATLPAPLPLAPPSGRALRTAVTPPTRRAIRAINLITPAN